MKREGGPRIRKPKRKICHACMNKVVNCDYKDYNMLKKYTSERGKILPRRISGNCAKHQRLLTTAIKQSRAIGLLAYTG